jgi:hypothetical protein
MRSGEPGRARADDDDIEIRGQCANALINSLRNL